MNSLAISDRFSSLNRCRARIWSAAMYQDTEKFVDLNFEQDVRKAAYHLWEKDGRPEGREKDYWFMALEQM
jgi:hypothetical protein